VTRAIVDAFPYVRAYHSITGSGVHYLASMTPIDSPDVDLLLRRLPPRARIDMNEWYWGKEPWEILNSMLKTSIDARVLLNYLEKGESRKYMITDDRPINEYFKLRRLFAKEDSDSG